MVAKLCIIAIMLSHRYRSLGRQKLSSFARGDPRRSQ